ncbi:hypothetical protein ADMFC3_27680 [Geovibrio sp. ADMFC3]
MIKIIGEFSGSHDEAAEFILTLSDEACSHIAAVRDFVAKNKYAVSAETVIPVSDVVFNTEYVYASEIGEVILNVDDASIEMTAVIHDDGHYVSVDTLPFFFKEAFDE